jgi:hypothetical protein
MLGRAFAVGYDNFNEKLSAYNWFELASNLALFDNQNICTACCVLILAFFAILKQNPVHETVKTPNAFINVS